jgi:hypothetical protein
VRYTPFKRLLLSIVGSNIVSRCDFNMRILDITSL